MEGSKLKIDVVIPTKGEWTLKYALDAVRKNVDVNRIILVITKDFEGEAKKLDAVYTVFDEKNVGKARNEGLKLVETDTFASIDSDVLVTKEWFNWCMKTIQKRNVGACQGYTKTFGKYYANLQMKYIRRGGKYGKGLCCLGNTMLKTNVVREVGMPQIPVEEDWQLRLRTERAGYKWISNLNIVCPHLKNDLDVWKHSIWWGSMGGKVVIRQQAKFLAWNMMKAVFKPKNRLEKIFSATNNLCILYGSFKRNLVTIPKPIKHAFKIIIKK